MLHYSLEILRNLAVIGAAVAVIAAVWRWFGSAKARDAAFLRRIEIAERQASSTDASRAHLATISADVAARREWNRQQAEARRTKVDVHRMLHATTDPFLTFAEIETELARLALEADKDWRGAAPRGADLRGVLIEMLGDGVIAQLDGDRYFIASEFETSEEAAEQSAG